MTFPPTLRLEFLQLSLSLSVSCTLLSPILFTPFTPWVLSVNPVGSIAHSGSFQFIASFLPTL